MTKDNKGISRNQTGGGKPQAFVIAPVSLQGENTMKHTEGKWEVNESDGVLTIVCTDLNNRKYYIGDVNGDADYEPTYRANANLIASAPEMLTTLKVVKMQLDVPFTKEAIEHLSMILGETIAKAEGSHTDES